ncbi:WhiB family transcriptional regulator [Rhodococcus rhodnii]|uniref:4Fe-4S Wbl-type domain-containing protein n=1 Tax=Rhodococcus rhodnii LMG 5362 TaxID=1273125 RepID=R7WHR3_9NOCA|nr:WhiB family transcriptional regulator [Rhodococcus rhodnii]EOM74617.1 hypothetical protein Rrhod_4092 [Rhodococcus rhodnii LMG 5362]
MSRRPEATSWVDLLGQILADQPALSGAACSGRPELFDLERDDETAEDRHYRHAAAKQLCAQCPVIDACATTTRTAGVVAGRLVGNPSRPPGRPRKDTAA